MSGGPYYQTSTIRDDDQHQLSQRALRERSSNARNNVADSAIGGDLHKVSHPHSALPRPISQPSSSQYQGRRGGHDATKDLATHDAQYIYVQLYKIRQRCESYQKYRQNQDKHVHNRAQDGVWPDDVEETFWKAIAANPPMGREKVKISPHSADTKAYGRNELIAKYMEFKLGEGFERLRWDSKKKQHKTPRKVVSSHIQVLKGKFKDFALSENQIVLHWLGKGDKKPKSARARAVILQSQRRAESYLCPLEPQCFAMYLAQNTGSQEKPVHQFAAPGKPAIPHSDAKISESSLRRDLPLLSALWQERRLRCSVISVQTSLDWRPEKPEVEDRADDDGRVRRPAPSLHLCIQNQFDVRNGPLPAGCYSVVRYFYGATFAGINGPHKVEFPDEGSRAVVELRIGSQFWVKTFQAFWKRIADAKKEAMHRGDSVDAEEVVRAVDEGNRQHIASITALVEIYKDCTEDQSGKIALSATPMMVIHWSFKTTTQPGEPGRTLWRNIILPDQGHPSNDDDDNDDDDDEMEHDTDTQDYSENNGAVDAASYQSLGLAQANMIAQMPSFDLEQTAAGSGMNFPWSAGDMPERAPGIPSIRADGTLDLDLANTFNFDDVPLDPNMIGDLDVSAIDASLLASMSQGNRNDAQSSHVINIPTSSGMFCPPQLQSQHGDIDESSQPHNPRHDVYSPFGNYFDRQAHGYGTNQGQYNQRNAQAHQMSSMRSTQQTPQQLQISSYPAASVSSGFAPPYIHGSQPDRMHNAATMNNASVMSGRRPPEPFGHERPGSRAQQPPMLSILPSQRESAPDSQPSTASTMPPCDHGRFQQAHESYSQHSDHAPTPQTSAGQPSRQHGTEASARQQQYMRMLGSQAYYQEPAFYPPPVKMERESTAGATTAVSASAGEQETASASLEHHFGAPSSHASRSFHYPEMQAQSYHDEALNDGQVSRQQYYGGDSQGSSELQHEWEQLQHGGRKGGHQRGLGLLFDPSVMEGGSAFSMQLGREHEDAGKNDGRGDHVEALGSQHLLPSPIDG